jgi:hypothetical protein
MATYISNQTGNWSTASTWVTAAAGTLAPTAPAGISPQSNGFDKIIIKPNTTVTYDVSGIFGDQTAAYNTSLTTAVVSANSIILSGGTLRASRLSATELTACGNIMIWGGALDWGTAVDPLTTNANITLHYMSQLSALSASSGAAGLYCNGSSFGVGTLYTYGKSRLRNTTLSAPAANGANVISVVSATNWEAGDKLMIATESIANNGTSTGVLSAVNIVSLTGNNITISPALNTSRSAGVAVGNFTSNINIKSYNPVYPAYGVWVQTSNLTTGTVAISLNNTRFADLANGLSTTAPYNVTGWASYGSRTLQTGTPTAMLTYNSIQYAIAPYTSKSLCFESNVNGPAAYPFQIVGNYPEQMTIEDIAFYAPTGTGGNSTALILNNSCNITVKNSYVYRCYNGINFSTAVPTAVIIDNFGIDADNTCFGDSVYGLQTTTVTNSKLRTKNVISKLDAIQNFTLKNCSLSSSASFQFVNPNINAVGTLNAINCTFSPNTPGFLGLIPTNKTGQSAQVNIYQPNNSTYDYRRCNYFHYSQTDLVMRKRGITSYKINPIRANTEFYNYFTIPAVNGNTYRVKGSLRFDSNYGVNYPPSISFVGAGVNTVFTCASTVNVWQDFDLSLSATSTDDILITITCQSSGTNGYVWLDGLPIYPFIQDVKHYGFVYDKNSYRTINTLNTLTENQVSALSTILNLNYLYDAASYWSVTNPASSSYIDLFTVDNSSLNFYNKNITFDSNASTVMSYNSSNNNIIIKTSNLYSQSNFDTIFTTGSMFFLNNVNIQSNVKIRSLNYDSEITYSGVDYVILYNSSSNANNSINPGLSSSNGIIRYKYGTTTQGIPMSGVVYVKWYSQANNISGIHVQTLNIGTTDLGDLLGYQVINSNFNIINNGIKNASVLIPHTTDINIGGGLTEDLQSLVNNQQIINNGLKKASILIPYT